MGPRVKKLGGADAVAEAVIDGGAEDHPSAAETGHLQAPKRKGKEGKWNQAKVKRRAFRSLEAKLTNRAQ